MKINQGDYFVLNDGTVFKCLTLHITKTYAIHAVPVCGGEINNWRSNQFETFTINGIYDIDAKNSKYNAKKL